MFEFLLLIRNAYDHLWHAEVRLVNQYFMTNEQTQGRRANVMEYDRIFSFGIQTPNQRKISALFYERGAKLIQNLLRMITNISVYQEHSVED